MRVLLASLALLLAGPPVPAGEDLPHAIDPGAASGVLVTVRTLAIDDLAGFGVEENALLAREVDLAWDRDAVPPGWVAPRSGLVARPVPLWQLGGAAREGLPFHGSALAAVLAELEAGLRERGITGARVELDRRALVRLSTPGGDGLLLLRIRRPGH